MAKFDAGTIVERLEFDFSEYGGPVGRVQEPTTGRVNGYFKEMKNLINQVKDLRKLAEGVDADNLDDLSEEQIADITSKMDEATARTDEVQQATVAALARLCGADYDEGSESWSGGSPTHEVITDLPYRVQRAFNEWLVGEIKPKGTTPATKH